MKLLIIIPAYNEGKSIQRVVEHLLEVCGQYDFIVINDGSEDDTADICQRQGYPLIDLPVNLGLAGAFQAGMQYAWRKGYDCALQFDGDGQHRPEYISGMLKELERGADIVIGSRFLENKRGYSPRMLGSRIISGAIWLTTGKRILDPTSGMRLFGSGLLEPFARGMNYGPEPDTISYLVKRGSKVQEYPVKMDERKEGTSYLSVMKSLDYMARMTISILLIQNFRK